MRERPGTCLIILLVAQLLVGLALLPVLRPGGLTVLGGLAGQLVVIGFVLALVLIREARDRRRGHWH